jgi:endoglucanase
MRHLCSFLPAGIAVLAAAAAPCNATAGTAIVRVNQVGYPNTSASIRAYLISTSAATDTDFSLSTVTGTPLSCTGEVAAASPSSLNSTYGFVYTIDIPASCYSANTAGMYTISVSGAAVATSPVFAIDTGAKVYGTALDNTLNFYQTERDGPDYIVNALRPALAPGACCHLNDEIATTYSTPTVRANGTLTGSLTQVGTSFNAAGGWWDAGDYLKFVETESYTVAMMLSGIKDFPAQMGSGGATDFTAEAYFGVQWLMQMWDDSTQTLYYQVGLANGTEKRGPGEYGDHDIWRLPQEDDTYGGTNSAYEYIRNRPVFQAAGSGEPVSPNLAGRLAAAFAECYLVYAGSSNPTYRSMAAPCLLAGEHVYALADSAPTGKLLTTIPYGFYPEVMYQDDMELGATELYFALAAANASGSPPPGLPVTNPSIYLAYAATWANAYINSTNSSKTTLNLYDVSGLAHYELYNAFTQAGSTATIDLATSRAALLSALKSQISESISTNAAADPFGFGYPWSESDTISFGAGLSVMASEYDELTGSSTYAAYADRWLANILGANAWGASFIVGDGTNFTFCPSHQVANLVGSLDGSAPVLAGAVVEGPTEGPAATGLLTGMNACSHDVSIYPTFTYPKGTKRIEDDAQFADNEQNYASTEPAIDLTSTSFLALSRQMAGIR